MGYLKQLAAQNVAKSTASGRAVMDMVIAGEFAIGINMFNYHAVISRAAGAPVDWQAIEPVPGLVKNLGLAKHAPHPHASMYLSIFCFRKTAKKFFKKRTTYRLIPTCRRKLAI